MAVFALVQKTGFYDYSMSLEDVFKSSMLSIFNPVTSGLWWFISAYVVIMLFSPTLNKFLLSLNKKGLIIYLAICWFLWYSIATTMGAIYYSLGRTLFFYSCGSIVRIYFDSHVENRTQKKSFIPMGIAIISWILMAICEFQYCSLKAMESSVKVLLLGKLFSSIETVVFVPLCSVALLMAFVMLNIGQNLFVNKIAKATIGVYLIHESFSIRPLLWNGPLNILKGQYMNRLFPLFAIITPVCIYIICTVIELIRQATISPLILNLIEKERKQFVNNCLKDSKRK